MLDPRGIIVRFDFLRGKSLELLTPFVGCMEFMMDMICMGYYREFFTDYLTGQLCCLLFFSCYLASLFLFVWGCRYGEGRIPDAWVQGIPESMDGREMREGRRRRQWRERREMYVR